MKDDNPSCIFPAVNWAIITSCFIIFIIQVSSGLGFKQMVETYGLNPYKVVHGGAYYTFFTSMFLHGGLIHLAGNMLYLYIFGDNIEDMCGHGLYLLFYLTCGIIASATYLFTSWNLDLPAIGASGAISGILGGYVRRFPKARILTAIPYIFIIRVVWAPAYLIIGIWFLYQFILAFIAPETGVAYWAHIGGFIAGLILADAFTRRKHLHPLHAYKIYRIPS
ncbi:MAG: rhomboid family intramembrane serine protease [Candidatus Bathyarchaeia archaeon]